MNSVVYPKRHKVKASVGRSAGFFRLVKRKLKWPLRCLVVLVPLLLVFTFFFRSGKFNVSAIQISGVAQYVSSGDLTSMLESKYMGSNILILKSAELKKTVLTNFLGAKTVGIKKVLPATLQVTIEERKPAAVLDSGKPEKYLVDYDGYVLGLVGSYTENLPIILYSGEIHVGKFIDLNVVPVYAELTDYLRLEHLSATSFSFNDKDVEMYLEDGTKVYLNSATERQKATKIIASLLNRLKLEGKTVKKIDLRYDKVIVSYD